MRLRRGIRRSFGWAIVAALISLLLYGMSIRLGVWEAIGLLLGAFAITVLLVFALKLILE